MSAFLGNANRTLFQEIFSWAHRWDLLDAVGVFLANYFPYLLVLGVILFIFEQRGTRRRAFFFFEATLAVLLSRGIVTETFRFFYVHPRPFDALGITSLIGESGNSFPSGHAALLFALAATILFYSRKWGIWYLVFALINGVARIFVGVHWPLDILGGALVGICSAILVHALLRASFLELYHEEHAASPSAS